MEFNKKNYSWTKARIAKEISQVNRELDELTALLQNAGPYQRGYLSYRVKVKEKVLASLRKEEDSYK